MNNQELLQKMKEDMEMRGLSHYTIESYELKAKDVMRYFKKPMEEVTIDELRNFFKIIKRRKMKNVLTKEELSTFFNACDNYNI